MDLKQVDVREQERLLAYIAWQQRQAGTPAAAQPAAAGGSGSSGGGSTPGSTPRSGRLKQGSIRGFFQAQQQQ